MNNQRQYSLFGGNNNFGANTDNYDDDSEHGFYNDWVGWDCGQQDGQYSNWIDQQYQNWNNQAGYGNWNESGQQNWGNGNFPPSWPLPGAGGGYPNRNMSADLPTSDRNLMKCYLSMHPEASTNDYFSYMHAFQTGSMNSGRGFPPGNRKFRQRYNSKSYVLIISKCICRQEWKNPVWQW